MDIQEFGILFDVWFSIGIKLIILGFLVFNIKGVNVALKGGNGHWSMDEVAKAVILGILLFMIGTDAHREHEWIFFPTWIYAIFVAGLFAMAKMEDVIDKALEIIKVIKGWTDKKKPESE